jgi:hypothetical protein
MRGLLEPYPRTVKDRHILRPFRAGAGRGTALLFENPGFFPAAPLAAKAEEDAGLDGDA